MAVESPCIRDDMPPSKHRTMSAAPPVSSCARMEMRHDRRSLVKAFASTDAYTSRAVAAILIDHSAPHDPPELAARRVNAERRGRTPLLLSGNSSQTDPGATDRKGSG